MIGTVPPAGEDRRAWIRYELQKRVNPRTKKRWSPADIAREAGASDSTVSQVYLGQRNTGLKISKIQRITARILGMTTDDLFGVALEAGDGYAGSR